MKNPNLSPVTKWSAFSLVLAVTAALLIAGELIFTIFRIPARGRKFEAWDVFALAAVFAAFCINPKMFATLRAHGFNRLPVFYKICVCIAIYVILLKVVYFAGFFYGRLSRM